MEKKFFIVLIFVLGIFLVACDDDGLNEKQYPQEVQDQANLFCEYWTQCGPDFYNGGENPPAWEGRTACKKWFYQMYELDYQVSGETDVNDHCYDCLMEEYDDYIDEHGMITPDPEDLHLCEI